MRKSGIFIMVQMLVKVMYTMQKVCHKDYLIVHFLPIG